MPADVPSSERSPAKVTATRVTIGLSLFAAVVTVGAAASSFPGRLPAWIEEGLLPSSVSSPLPFIAFVLFFLGVRVIIYRTLEPHPWTVGESLVVLVTASLAGMIAGAWLSQAFLGTDWGVAGRRIYAFAGALALDIVVGLAIWRSSPTPST